MQGLINRTDGLWDIELPSKNNILPQQSYHPTSSIDYIITKDKTKSDVL